MTDETTNDIASVLDTFRCHKIVRAGRIVGIGSVTPSCERVLTVEITGARRFTVWIPDRVFARGLPEIGDFLVVYPPIHAPDDRTKDLARAYISWSPAAPFVDGYEPLIDTAEGTKTIGQVVEDALLQGERQAPAAQLSEEPVASVFKAAIEEKLACKATCQNADCMGSDRCWKFDVTRHVRAPDGTAHTVFLDKPDARQTDSGDLPSASGLFRKRYRNMSDQELALHDAIKETADNLATLVAHLNPPVARKLGAKTTWSEAGGLTVRMGDFDPLLGRVYDAPNVTLAIRHLEDAVYRAVKALTG